MNVTSRLQQRLFVLYLILVTLYSSCDAFCGAVSLKQVRHPSRTIPVSAASARTPETDNSELQRRQVLNQILGWTCIITTNSMIVPIASAAETSLTPLLAQVKQARSQLDAVPALIEKEQWDSVRAILITPPLSDCWAKTGKPLLQQYAEAVGDAGLDELEALEGKEDASSHLRFLDMAVYNNVFNPITTMGETGATKQLIQSYYEDPINEYKASVSALEALIRVGTESP